MSNMLIQNLIVDGVHYFLDSSQPVKKVIYFDGNKWILSSEFKIQNTAPNTSVIKWWLDMSLTPPKLKYFDGNVWKTLTMT